MKLNNKSTREIGGEGEELAAAYLESKGYTILERNYFFKRAEVDIIAYDEKQIVFVEVKLRSGKAFGEPEDAISEEKMRNIYKAAEAWIYERKMEGAPVRFDIVSILRERNRAPLFKHFQDTFRLTR